MRPLFTALTLAASLAAGSPAAAAVIGFDTADEQGATLMPGDSLSAQGFVITQLSEAPSILFAGDLVGAYASNGTPSLYAANQASLALTAGGGGRFSLLDLEVGGGNLAFLDDPGAVAPWAAQVVLDGLFADGTMRTMSLDIDPASAALARFTVGWTDLVEIRLGAAGDYSLDNLNLQGIPEPASSLLVALAVAGVAAARARRR